MQDGSELLDILEVDSGRVPHNTSRALVYLCAAWIERGRPMEAGALADFLDDKLKFCTDVGFRYPKVFLLRLKQLQRGEWGPHGATVQ